MDECIQARERAHAAYAEAGDNRRAADAAIRLFQHHYQKLESSVAMGWLS